MPKYKIKMVGEVGEFAEYYLQRKFLFFWIRISPNIASIHTASGLLNAYRRKEKK